MMLKHTACTIALSLTAALALSACNKHQEAATESTPAAPSTMAMTPAQTPPATTPASGAVQVASVDLGSAVGADEKVTAATTSFTPKDTIYASVATTGSGTATLDAKWTFQTGQTVKEDSKSIAPTGPAATAFSISKPDGWPAGNYKVEISLNGTSVATKDFSVK